ncbi:DEAD/DEAH box helicase [Candidatus Woesearchaeota archaeon]|nr:DEAD/DEAH box helicase [Candidatus Woesearchaeota archaeon]
MKFKGFTLDDFQVEAAKCIDKGNSVVVSAATGTGKTLIADYIIDKYIKKGKRIIYTAPIKALSNQKYRDFKKEYGYSNIGIMTGDIVINPEAPVLIMTTEIYRNMLMTKDPNVKDVSYVIFDEIHFINDIERGTVWEESIIFSPENIRFLCLSATIPNAKEFASWIQSIKHHKVDVVRYNKRAVPLEHFVFDKAVGITKINELIYNNETPDYDKVMRKKKRRRKKPKPPRPENLIRDIRDKLPCLFFVFSRKSCEKKAYFVSKKFSFLNNSEKAVVSRLSSRIIPSDFKSMESVHRLRRVLPKGIAFHHAGMLPYSKELVETLFAKGLIKVLFATETFAVGINMPAKSVAFSSMFKYDGVNFRNLYSKEYFQMAGRAGRRGIDKKGFVYVMVDRSRDDLYKIKKITTADVEPIKSQFKLSYNTVINLIHNYKEETKRDKILKSNFDYYQRKKRKNIRIKRSFNNKMRKLEKFGFVKNNDLTEKGMFARRIYDQEILVSEIFCSDFYEQLKPWELILICAAIVYEPGKNDHFEKKGSWKRTKSLSHFLKNRIKNHNIYSRLDKRSMKNLYKITSKFAKGDEFSDIMELTNLEEGDVIRLFRRTIDLMRQIRNATNDYDLKDQMGLCIHKLNRIPIKVEF